MNDLHVLRVFCGPDREGGNPLGVFLDGSTVPEERRQAIAADLGFSETVFVDDPGAGMIRIFTPETELPFAGHPSVGTAWLLRESGNELAILQAPAGDLPVRYEAGDAYVSARPEWSPPFATARLGSPSEVEALDGPPEGEGFWYPWAWIEEQAGTIRARSFVPGAGVPEDEATGSAAVILCAELGRPIEVHQGRGSRIHARPVDPGMVEFGGRTVLDEVRDYGTT